ncbi:MAG: class I SAM-dependent methyltransferase, partial [Flavipsychrobacter sp.]
MTKKNDYDPIAGLYDRLSYLFFGNAQRRAQTFFLKDIPLNSRILIVGGGTGWILEEIAKQHPGGFDITYVELSGKMIELSRRRNVGQNAVHFINESIEAFSTAETFDVAITAFLFDNFSEQHARSVFLQIHSLLKPGGLWLVSDFDAEQANHHLWQRAMLAAMYFFFRLVCRVEAKELVRLKPLYADNGYTLRNYTYTYGRFI